MHFSLDIGNAERYRNHKKIIYYLFIYPFIIIKTMAETHFRISQYKFQLSYKIPWSGIFGAYRGLLNLKRISYLKTGTSSANRLDEHSNNIVL